MSDVGMAASVFVCVFSAAMLGVLISGLLPETHQSPESKDVVKLAAGLVATIAALVLSLLISSAKSSFDTMDAELLQNASRVVRLDRLLADYGSDTRELRGLVKQAFGVAVERLFPHGGESGGRVATAQEVERMESLRDKLWSLSPQTESQRWMQAQAVQIADDMTATHWLLLMQRAGGLPMALLVVLVSWLMIIFLAFGLFAPRNATVFVALFVCSLSVSGAVFLILEMNSPLVGLIRVSPMPMRTALADLGR